MRISIAMCSYNGAAYIREQLQSIASQTRLPDELVICDDGSQDSTISVVLEASTTAGFSIRLVQNSSRLRSTANFSQAIGLCTGELVVLVDQDDVWHPDKLLRIEEHFIAKPATGAIFSNAGLIDAQSSELSGDLWGKVGLGPLKQQAIQSGHGFDLLLRANFVTGATMAFRANLKDVLLPIPESWVHDYWIAVISSVVSNLDCIDKNLVQYRCHGAQQLGVNRGFTNRWHRFIKFDPSVYLSSAAMWLEMARRLERIDADRHRSIIVECHSMAQHMKQRGSLPRQRLKRLRFLMQETMNGKYHRYSLGLPSILHDFLAR